MSSKIDELVYEAQNEVGKAYLRGWEDCEAQQPVTVNCEHCGHETPTTRSSS